MIEPLQRRRDAPSFASPPGYSLIERRWEEPKANVFLAQDLDTGGFVLLKASKIRRLDLRDLDQLRRDYEIGRQFSIEGLVRPIRHFSVDGAEYLALENDSAYPVAEILSHGRLDLAGALQFGAALAGHMHQLHAAGFIHNNLTPYSVWHDPERQQARIADFAFAERASVAPLALRQQMRLAGDLRYISPEQSGRIGQIVDSRSDLYAVGAILYEALTGAPPFDDIDPLGLIHAHLARTPTPPHILNPTVPEVVSRIVLKLLFKRADERYQSGKALKADLEECLAQWRLSGKIDPFTLAVQDLSSVFRVSGELYGRESEVASLRAALDRAAAGAGELCLVAGPAGVGKTRLVRQAEPYARAIGSFVATKFDQFRINQPYALITQALRDLVQQMLAQSESAIAFWKSRLSNALGPNGQIIVDLVPELELVIGPQSPVEELPATEKRNRFFRVFHSFMSAFMRKGNPLCIFVDDLQWADAASVELLTSLLSDPQTQYLLVIAAFRNEDDATRSDSSPIAQIAAQSVHTTQLTLANLEPQDVSALLKDSFQCGTGEAEELARLIRRKTAGNPFFVRQFLSFVHQEQLIQFDYQASRWRWDLRAISEKGVTDDVLGLMSHKLSALPNVVRDVLRTAACLGNEFDAAQLALVTDYSEAIVRDALANAESEGIIVEADQQRAGATNASTAAAHSRARIFRFLHDRMQQASYSLTPLADRPALRLRIGQALLAQLPTGERENVPFAIVDNINEGMALIEAQDLRAEFARLNLQVGQRAREAAAYEAALGYFGHGLAMLCANSWRERYDLTRDLYLARFECAYVLGRTDEANALFRDILENAKSRLEKAKAYYTKILLTTGVEHSQRAVAYGLEGLRLFNEKLPPTPNKFDLFKALFQVFVALRGRRARDLINLPTMTDPDRKAVIELLMSICPAAYFKNPDLMALSALRIMRLSLRHGNASASSFGYVLYGLICTAILGRYKTGHEFGRLAVELANSSGRIIQRCKILMIFAGFINFWREPIDTSIETSFESLKLGLDAGDVQYANYSILQILFLSLARGANLDDVRCRCKDFESPVAQTKDLFAITNIELRKQFVLALQDFKAPSPDFNRDGYEESDSVDSFLANGNLTTMAYYYVLKTQICYYFGEYSQAYAYSRLAEAEIETALGQIVVAEHYFFQGLSAAALLKQGSLAAGPLRRALRRARSKLKKWAINCPQNFQQHYELLTAESAMIGSNIRKAELWYDKSIESAQNVRFLHIEALASELAAEAYLKQGRRQVAQTYFEAARRAYVRWGAKAKVRLLEEKYPDFLSSLVDGEARLVSFAPRAATAEQDDLFDFDMLARATAEIAREFQGDQLARKLMRLILECASGESGLLIMCEADELHLRAIVSEGGAEALLTNKRAQDDEAHYSPAIVNYALRTGELIFLKNAGDDSRFSACPYLRSRNPRAIVCLPLVRQGATIGAVYIENSHVASNFTHNRIQALTLLSHQVCTLVENTDLSQQLSDHAISLQGALKNIALLERMKEHLEKFVPGAVQRLIEKNPQHPDLEARQEDVSVMFLDMSGYTALSERMRSDELNAIVETYFSSFFDDLHSHGGDISEVAGDGLMIIFQSEDRDQHAVSAVRAALAVRDKTDALNRRLAGKWPTVAINIGVHSGAALLGAHKMQGAAGTKRWTFTVTGFAANLAARICGYAAGGAVVISGETATRSGERFDLASLGVVQFKGVSAQIELFSVAGERHALPAGSPMSMRSQ